MKSPKTQVFNPYLPGHEYIPDGEPRLFGNRVYIYGSHDRFNGFIFCLNDYVCYSAPDTDLSDWKYEGIIYRKKQDPSNKLGLRLLFAPDVVRGWDGRYYLYYTLDFLGIMGVAVGDTPAGSFKFLSHIKYPDGIRWGRKKNDHFPFDPGVLVDDDGRIYLYSGFSEKIPRISSGFIKLQNKGGTVLELETDMVTIKNGPYLIFPQKGEGSFPGHEFYEASSIRKINGKYYFVYSSIHNHELCYAVSEKPMSGYVFGGSLISLGDLDNTADERRAVNYLGNTHGGILSLGRKFYIFYHRQTNRHSFSRQACAEELKLDSAGHFRQAELTSCGLNGGPLSYQGEYEARIACNLWSKNGVGRYDSLFSRIRFSGHPYLTQSGKDRDKFSDQFIANIRDGAVAGFKYFEIDGLTEISIKIRGKAEGRMSVYTDKELSRIVAVFPINIRNTKKWIEIKTQYESEDGIHALYFNFTGKGKLDFFSFILSKPQSG